MNGMRKYGLTLLGLLISIVVLLGAIIKDLDLFESVTSFLNSVERFEVDEFIIPIIIFLFFAGLDLLKRRKSRKVELEKLKIYKAMLGSTHHILNNFLNQMQLFKITADRTPGFAPEILDLYDQIMNDASMQIEALGSITNISESSIETSIDPNTKYQEKNLPN